MNQLSIASLNVCGLKRRATYPEFIELVQKFDVLCVNESKLDKYDHIKAPGYTFINVPRKQKFKRKSGGLGAFIKDDIFQYFKIIESKSDYLFWLKFTGSEIVHDPVIIGIVYVPPLHSRFYSNDMFEVFDNEISEMSSKFEYLYLCGDFNAHTGELVDYTTNDDFISEYFQFNEDLTSFVNQKALLLENGIKLKRCSPDSKRNNHGYKLIGTCKNNNLIIVNGRTTGDIPGRMTFRNISVIDYFISSVKGYDLIDAFEIQELDPLFSDGHSILQCKINIKIKTSAKNKKKMQCKKWNKNLKYNFTNSICENEVATILKDLFSITNTTFEQDKLDKIVEKLTGIYINSAEKTFPGKKSFNITNNPQKPWFGPDCKKARKLYSKSRKKYCKYPTLENRNVYYSKSKIYKKTMNKYKNYYNKINENKLRLLNSKNPRDYWKYLNSINAKDKGEMPPLESLYKHFREVNNDLSHEHDDQSILSQINLNVDNMLNSPFTPEEISKCIKNLQNNKAPGIDGVINEYIKCSQEKLLPVYVSLFNIILNHGAFPSQWSLGTIIPIYKNKGDRTNPECYRPITLLSCVSKLFTSVLNTRLSTFLDRNNMLSENQAGFRSGYSTTDHVFTINSLIELFKFHKQKLYCCFIDFSKAFDSVWRIGLWSKLLETNINGKFLLLIRNMYKDIKSCISSENDMSDFFSCNCGVRQGENLSPILFSLFLNDLEDFLNKQGNEGLKFENPDLNIILKILVLLYADDTVLIADQPQKLQLCLNSFDNYCKTWKLHINLEKTKVMIFGSRSKSRHTFHINNSQIEIVKSYKYLGTYFTNSGNFLVNRKHLAEQAKKALFYFYKRINNLNLPPDLIFKLFDNTISPILLYNSEIWGYEDKKLLERILCTFIKKYLHLKASTPNYMVYAETGRYPLEISIKTRMIGYWIRLITGKESKIAHKIYKILLNTQNFKSKWITEIKSILTEIGRQDIWLNQNTYLHNNTKSLVNKILIDQYQQQWHSNLEISSKGKIYGMFKENINLEHYFTQIPKKDYLTLVKFRTSNHYLPIETGRWNNIHVEARKCKLCNLNDTGDEMHYLLICPYFHCQRKLNLKPYYYTKPNVLKFKQIMNVRSVKQLHKLSTYILLISNFFKNNWQAPNETR